MAKGKTAASSSRARVARKEHTPDSGAAAAHNEVAADGSFLPVFALLLFCSGAAALVYQVLWIKQLSLVVGAEVYSVTIAVSAFFAGLGCGNAVFGRLADRLARPFRTYALLEACVGTFGIGSTVALAHAASPFAALELKIGPLAWLLPFVLVALPAFFMGGTLPVAIRAWEPAEARIARRGGNAYAINTAGGIAGALLSTFALLPIFGVRGSAYAAAALNLMAALMALLLDRRQERRDVRPDTKPLEGMSRDARLALIFYSVAGGIALGYEVVWSQAIIQFLSTRSFAFSVVLATYLFGLVVGSALYARYADKVTDSWGVFGLLVSAAGLVALLEIAALSYWQLWLQAEAGNIVFAITRSEFARMSTRFLIAAMGMIFVPTMLLGAAFPAALRLVAKARSVGRDAGVLIALNTFGGIAGTLITGLLLIPKLGLVHTLAVLAIAAASVGTLAALRDSRKQRRLLWAVAAVAVVAVVMGFTTPADRLGRLLVLTRGRGTVIAYEESKGGTVAVVHERAASNDFRRLYIQGVSNSGDGMPSLRYMRLQALLPLIIHTGEPRSALVIGFGTGITAGALLQYPDLKEIVCAELLPAVLRVGPLFHGNFNAASDPRLQIRLRDGRRELVRSSQRYDLITLEPPPPSAAGVVNLYSRDFYALAAKRLEPNGIVAQWLPLAAQNDADTRSLVRSFLDVFPYASLWTTELHETMLVGSLSPMELNAQRIAARFDQPAVAASLQEVGVNSSAALLATWLMGREGLLRYTGDAPAVTDDRPRIEYASWVRAFEVTRTLPNLLALRSDPPIVGADDALLSAVKDERASLLDFYTAGLAAYNGDRELWKRTIVQALKNNQDNPYYRWSLGSR